MERPNYLAQIRQRIADAELGTVFIPSDFFDIAEAVKVNMCLHRLKKSDDLIMVMRGVFAKPRHSALLDKGIPPSFGNIAKAIARNYGWTIVPCGDTALNSLGLSTQLTSVYSYMSDGPYKTYTIDGMQITFKHTNRTNELNGVSFQTALVIQALRALERDNITMKELKKISEHLSSSEKKKLHAESQHITSWVYENIKLICKEDENSHEASR
ncbi:MAG: DUF6088 family protein [Clostridia bacterium]